MALQREGTDNLTGGEVNSLPPHLVGLSEAVLAENIDPRDLRGATTRNGRAQFSSNFASGNAIDGLKQWTRDNGTNYNIIRIGTTFYDASTASFASIGIGGTSGEVFRAGALNDLLCIVVDGLTPKKYNGSTLADLGGTPPSEAKYAAVHNSKLFLAGDDANPQKLSASATNNPDDWTTANDAFTITTQDGGGDVIKGLASNKKVLVIFYNTITDILIGTTVLDYRVERLVERGLVSPTGYCSIGEVVFFAAQDAIYMVAGTRVSDLSTLKFQKVYKDISDKTKISLGAINDLLLVVDYGADKAYVVAYKYNHWAEWTGQAWKVMDTDRNIIYAGADGGSTSQLWQLDSGSLDGSTSVTAKWRTPNLMFGWPDAIKTVSAVKVHAKPGIGSVSLTFYKDGTDIGSYATLTFDSSGDHDIQGRKGLSKWRGSFLGMAMQWTGPGTVYGWAIYSDVRTEPGEIPVEY